MIWLLAAMAILSAIFLLTLPGWIPAPFIGALLWTIGLLYLIFYPSDRLAEELENLQSEEGGSMR